MAELHDADSMNSDLDDRLEIPAGDEEISTSDIQRPATDDDYPLSELKNLILSIDWEITDEILNKLLRQIEDLSLTYEQDRIVLTFLQILNSLGAYIKKHRAKAHPKTFKTLNSVFSSLDKVVSSREMDEAQKKKILSAEMNRYRQLKAQIAQNRAGNQKNRPKQIQSEGSAEGRFEVESDHGTGGGATACPNPDITAAALADAVEEIKRTIHAEIETLKQELQAWREK